MTDFSRQILCRFYVGATSVLRRCRAGAGLGICLVAFSASASPYAATWAAFEARCLAPFEAFEPPVVSDLVPVAGQTGAYQLSHGAVLSVAGASDLGSRSCSVTGAGLVKGFESWLAENIETGRYVAADAPGVWLSHEWIEPRIAIEKTDGAVRVVETELES